MAKGPTSYTKETTPARNGKQVPGAGYKHLQVEVHEKSPVNPMRGYGGKAFLGVLGRPPSAVALACRMAFEERVPLLKKIADGKIARVHEVATASGKVVAIRIQPTIRERIQALEVLAKCGRVYSDEPLGVDHPVASKLDLSQYNTTELLELERLLAKGLRTSGEDAGEATSLPPSAPNSPRAG
jgi:hypothetical protein